MRIVKPETEEDVIAKFAAEVEMDSKYEASVVSDIEARLARLRGESVHGEVGESSKDFLSSSAQQSTKIDSLTYENLRSFKLYHINTPSSNNSHVTILLHWTIGIVVSLT